MDIPVYLIAGFLDAGKTDFINGILRDGFAAEDRTLLICCEEGENEYDPKVLQNVFTYTVDEQEQLTPALFKNPLHPYTQGLFDCAPRLVGGGISTGIYGYVPDYFNPPKGCRFCTRCKYCTAQCEQSKPPQVEVEPGHFVACFKYV